MTVTSRNVFVYKISGHWILAITYRCQYKQHGFRSRYQGTLHGWKTQIIASRYVIIWNIISIATLSIQLMLYILLFNPCINLNRFHRAIQSQLGQSAIESDLRALFHKFYFNISIENELCLILSTRSLMVIQYSW